METLKKTVRMKPGERKREKRESGRDNLRQSLAEVDRNVLLLAT